MEDFGEIAKEALRDDLEWEAHRKIDEAIKKLNSLRPNQRERAVQSDEGIYDYVCLKCGEDFWWGDSKGEIELEWCEPCKTKEIQKLMAELEDLKVSVTTPVEKQPTPDSSPAVQSKVKKGEKIMDRWWELHKDDPEVSCDICQKPFKKMDAKQKFCSLECRRRHLNNLRIKEQPLVDCEQCTKQFQQTRSDRKYCSVKCMQAADRARQGKEPVGKFTHICRECDKSFHTTHPQQRYCSIVCSKAPRLREKREYHVRTRTHDCPECGKGTTKLYCSDDCRKKYEEKLIQADLPTIQTEDCIVCDKKYIPKNKFQKTCSDECKMEKNRQYQRSKRAAAPARALTNDENLTHPGLPQEQSASVNAAEKPVKFKRVILPPSGEPTPSKTPYKQWQLDLICYNLIIYLISAENRQCRG